MEKYRMDTSKGMEFGLYSIGDHVLNPHNGEKISTEQRIHELIET
ncbi:LLM class flavin-dependent oxidoreductase, partial [Bacillus anthracis]